MTLTPETGAGLANADSYVSASDAATYLTTLGYTDWTADATEREQLLRQATAFMEQQYRNRWKGTRLTRDQALSWPRYGACADGYNIESTIVPIEVQHACALLAYKAASGDLNPDIERAVKREKLGPLETEYADYGSQSTQYRSVDQLLAGLLKGSSMNAMLIRA